MSNKHPKSIESVQRIQEILRSASKEDVDKETKQAKLAHVQDKLEQLKDVLHKESQQHQRELKAKEKQIRKRKQAERQLSEKLEQAKQKSKQSNNRTKHKHEHVAGCGNDQGYVMSPETHALERQTRKRREAQQRAHEYKMKVEELETQIARHQRQQQKLREIIEAQKILLQQFSNQANNESEEPAPSQSESDMNDQIQLSVHKNKPQMMDISEGRSERYEQIEEPRKQSEDMQTDDQEQQSDQFIQKLISKASQNEKQKQVPELRQINSVQTEKQQAMPVQPATEQGQKKETQKTDSEKQIDQKQEDKKQGWFSWSNWWKR